MTLFHQSEREDQGEADTYIQEILGSGKYIFFSGKVHSTLSKADLSPQFEKSLKKLFKSINAIFKKVRVVFSDRASKQK